MTVRRGVTGAVYRRSDWEFVRGLSIRGYATGIRFEKAKVPTNAVIAGSDVSDCSVALRLDDLNWVGLACYDSAFSGVEATVDCASDFRSTVLFNACTLAGAPIRVSARGMALGQLVPLGADAEGAVVADEANAGVAKFFATQVWPKNPVFVNGGVGMVLLDQFNACGCPPVAEAPSVRVRLAHFSR